MAQDGSQSDLAAQDPLVIDPGSFALALSAARMGELVWEFATDTFVVSQRIASITGLAPGRWNAEGGEGLYRHVHADDRDRVRADGAAGRGSRQHYNQEFRFVRPDDGRTIWLLMSAIAIGPPGGDPTRVVGVIQDITERKTEDAQREALVAELDHRVKNVLAQVQSLAAQSARKTVSLDAFLKTFAGRLEAMASAHTLLTATRWRGAEIANIAAAELGALSPGQARWSGPEVVLSPRATNALTLALHELVTNAVKFGSLSSEFGHVDVTWAIRREGGFVLTWVEKGGPPVSLPSRRGFGCTLLDRVTGRELGGSAVLEFRPDGVRATLTADATALFNPNAPSRFGPPVVPAAPAPPPTEGAPSTGSSSGGAAPADIRGLKVLIVEDSVLLAVELEAGLTEAGATVVANAADLEEGLRSCALAFDVGVLDANLNGQSVVPVAAALAQRGTPFIFATGYGDTVGAPEGFDAPVVRKPYNVQQIAAAIVEAMGRTKAA